MVYKWKNTPGLIEHKEGFVSSATLVGQELERIEAKKGKLLAEDVVKEARNEDNVLHNYFEWDDEIAGEKFRLMQSRILIKSIEVVHEKASNPLPAFANVVEKSTGERVYKNITNVLNNTEDYNYTLDRARREFLSYKDKYQKMLDIKDLKDMILENI